MSDFRNSTVYQIYIKSFCDSNGDGIGDINGIRQKLDYLQDLGIDYLWITPFFKSPMNDNGYDVADYLAINPMFGTMEDVDALIREAKEHNIRLMFDMVFNHTSTWANTTCISLMSRRPISTGKTLRSARNSKMSSASGRPRAWRASALTWST